MVRDPVLGLLLGLLLLAPASPAAGPAAPEILAPPGAQFRVTVPGPVTERRSSRVTPVGRVVERQVRVAAGGARFWVTWTELPRLAVWWAGEAGLYARVRRELVQDTRNREVSFESVVRDGRSGCRLRYVERGGEGAAAREGRLEAFLLGRRLLVFDATAPADAASPALEHFFGSLRLEAPSGEAYRVWSSTKWR